MTALDFPGFGQSAPLKEAFSVFDYAEWTKEALGLLGVVRPHVVAHSFGCRVAVKMAKGDGQVFDKILLTGPAGVILKRGTKYRTKVRLYRLVRKIAPRFAEKHFGSTEYRSLPPVMRRGGNRKRSFTGGRGTGYDDPARGGGSVSFRTSKGKDETNGGRAFRFCGISRLLQFDCGGIFRS